MRGLGGECQAIRQLGLGERSGLGMGRKICGQ
jgi:hypothetical protein